MSSEGQTGGTTRWTRSAFVVAAGTLALVGACSGKTSSTATAMAVDLGTPCLPSEELGRSFGGFDVNAVTVETDTAQCGAGVCLVANFQGRVTCPYGQPASSQPDPSGRLLADPNVPASDRCYTAGAGIMDEVTAVQVPVAGQLVSRSPDKAVYCSCRCAGPDKNATYCACPEGYVCQDLVDAGDESVQGSYCIKKGTAVMDPTALRGSLSCDAGGPPQPRPAGCGFDKHPSDALKNLFEGDAGSASSARSAKSATFSVDVLSTGGVEKLDLLLMIDNSIDMADKQAVFRDAVPNLVQRLVNPNCVDPSTGVAGPTPPDPSVECPAPRLREFRPIRDLHVGIITSSIGGHGSALCDIGLAPSGNDADPVLQQQNDHGYLIGTRSRYGDPPGGFPADPSGFLNWNPDVNAEETMNAFTTTFQAMTVAAGEQGCGLESQLESIYRFLVDPNPYQQITISKCPNTNEDCAIPTGKDTNLLAQRAAFLRPDSIVGIVMVTDENDCSIQESGQYYYAARQNIALPHGSSVCAQNPNDKCCYFCNAAPPAGCAVDPTCTQGISQTPALDPPNLRCFHQKQRFGFDFLYPTARYVNAFTQAQICTSRPDLAPDQANCKDADGDKKPDLYDNPLFVGANGSAAVPRDLSLIFLAGLVGVPYQDLQTGQRPAGTTYDPNELHYRTAAQLSSDGTWNVILGSDNPGTGQPPILPTDNLMVESDTPRGGSDGQMQPLAPPSSPRNANPVNGHEWNDTARNDLQYACIFPLKQTRDCAGELMKSPQPGCDCKADPTQLAADQNPLCEDAAGNYTSVQWAAKAYPSLRELQVLKDFGNNAVVGSICPRNLTDTSRQDYGYHPFVDALADRIKEGFRAACLGRALPMDVDRATGKTDVSCDVLEARPDDGQGCSEPGRSAADKKLVRDALARLASGHVCDASGKPACSSLEVCQVNEAGRSCHVNQPPIETGWCYVDPANDPGDDPTIVDGCPPTQRRLIRFVDPMNHTPAPDATVLLVCY